MAKTRISEYSVTNSSNTDINSINIDEGCAPSGINNAIREVMVHLKNWQTNASGDGATFASLVVQGTGSFTGAVTMSAGATLSGTNTLSGSNIISGNINSSGSANTFSGSVVHSGTNTFSSSVIISGNINSSGTTNTFSGGNILSGTNTLSGSTVMAASLGTSASPSIYFTSDTNTGIFSPTADTVGVATGGSERMRVDSSGNVGIGNTSPSSRLDVTGVISLQGTTLPSAGTARIFSRTSDSSFYLQSATSGTIYLLDGSQNTMAGFGSSTLQFFTGNTERMCIDSSGNVGIGTSSPAQRLHILGASAASARARVENASGYLIDVYAGVSDGVGLLTGNNPMFFEVNGSERARITSGGYFKASDNGTYVSSTGAYHEFRNTGDGPFLYGSCTYASFASSGLLVQISRNTTNNTFYAIDYYNVGASAYKFRVADSGNVTNTNGSYGTISDAKLKQDIVDAGSQWNDIKNLRFRKYRLKSEVELDPNAKPFLGLVAQEAELVSPGLIEEHRDTKEEKKTREIEKTREVTPAVLDDEGNEVTPAITETYTETEEYTETVDLGTTTKSIKTSILYMKAVKALQEAQLRIETLEAQNAAFEARLAALENK